MPHVETECLIFKIGKMNIFQRFWYTIFELISNFFVVSEIELPTLIYYDLVDKKQNSNTYSIMNIREKCKFKIFDLSTSAKMAL